MRRLREKLHSERGASILLALLLFFLCCMVAATVVAAASSNAGKIRSNLAEHQKQLTLSSALELVCDMLTDATYTGKYEVYEWTVPEEKDAAGNVIQEKKDFFYVKQTTGEFKCDNLDGLFSLTAITNEMDAAFSKPFIDGGAGYKPLYGSVGTDATHTLTVTLPKNADGTLNLDGYYPTGSGAYAVPTDVNVEITFSKNDHKIKVTASLVGSDEKMTATLAVENWPSMSYAPSGRNAGAGPGGDSPTSYPTGTVTPAKWTLESIKGG